MKGIAQQIAAKYQQTSSWPTTVHFGSTTVGLGGSVTAQNCANTPIAGLDLCELSYGPNSVVYLDKD